MKANLSLLGCAVLAAMISNLAAQTAPSDQPASTQQCEKKHHGGPKGNFGEKLGLNDEQKAKLMPLLKKTHDSIQAIKENTSLSMDQKHQQIASLHESVAPQIKAILTPEQYQKWQEIKPRKNDRPGKNPTPTT